MPWVKVDDNLHAHPKVRRAWQAEPASVGLFFLALTHASAYLTDGHVNEAFVRDQIPEPVFRHRTTTALVDAGLWERNGDSWIIHDYLKYNDPAVKVLARRRAREEKRRENRQKLEASRNRLP